MHGNLIARFLTWTNGAPTLYLNGVSLKVRGDKVTRVIASKALQETEIWYRKKYPGTHTAIEMLGE